MRGSEEGLEAVERSHEIENYYIRNETKRNETKRRVSRDLPSEASRFRRLRPGVVVTVDMKTFREVTQVALVRIAGA